MPPIELTTPKGSALPPIVAHGQHVMTVCNACRYCEQYCPVFPAMEQRLTFAAAALVKYAIEMARHPSAQPRV